MGWCRQNCSAFGTWLGPPLRGCPNGAVETLTTPGVASVGQEIHRPLEGTGGGAVSQSFRA